MLRFVNCKLWLVVSICLLFVNIYSNDDCSTSPFNRPIKPVSFSEKAFKGCRFISPILAGLALTYGLVMIWGTDKLEDVSYFVPVGGGILLLHGFIELYFYIVKNLPSQKRFKRIETFLEEDKFSKNIENTNKDMVVIEIQTIITFFFSATKSRLRNQYMRGSHSIDSNSTLNSWPSNSQQTHVIVGGNEAPKEIESSYRDLDCEKDKLFENLIQKLSKFYECRLNRIRNTNAKTFYKEDAAAEVFLESLKELL